MKKRIPPEHEARVPACFRDPKAVKRDPRKKPFHSGGSSE